MKRQSRLGSTLAAFVVASGLVGCTDLSAVRDWSGTSLEGVQFAGIVETYADTPARLIVYDAEAAAAHEAQARVREKQAEALKVQLSLVGDYMAALNALAADSVTDYTADIGALQTSLTGTGVVSAPTVGAVGKLATTLLNAATKGWQMQQIQQLIEQANEPLQTVLAGELGSIVREDFKRDLAIEAQFLNRYFKDLLRDPNSDATGRAALQEWFVLRKAENGRRQAAVDAYLAIIENIADGHQKLYDGRDDLAAKTLAKDLFKLAKDIRAQLKAILRA